MMRYFKDLNTEFTRLNNDKCIVKEDVSSRKLKIQSKMISLIKKHLDDADKLIEFNNAILSAKRSYTTKTFLYVYLWF